MGHQGSYERKIQAIEHLDREVIAEVCAGLDNAREDYRLLIMPDHSDTCRCAYAYIRSCAVSFI